MNKVRTSYPYWPMFKLWTDPWRKPDWYNGWFAYELCFGKFSIYLRHFKE